jgi:hypothetical protein
MMRTGRIGGAGGAITHFIVFPFLDGVKAMGLIEEIVEALSMDIRGNSRGLEYLEAVLDRKDQALLNSLLEKHIGLAAKESGKEQNLPREINELRQTQKQF